MLALATSGARGFELNKEFCHVAQQLISVCNLVVGCLAQTASVDIAGVWWMIEPSNGSTLFRSLTL